jgi:bifunctional non-homologous end joining protein LigD
VKTDLDPKRFTIRTVPTLLAKTSAWQDYCDGQRALEQAIKRLAKSMKQAA